MSYTYCQDTSDVAGDADNLTDQANKKRMSSAGGLNLLSSKPRKRVGIYTYYFAGDFGCSVIISRCISILKL